MIRILFSYTLAFFSVSKGIAANMLKASSKRRRTKAQIKDDKERVLLEEAETQRKFAELAELRARLD